MFRVLAPLTPVLTQALRYDNIENRKQQLRKMQFADDVEQNSKAKSSAKSQNVQAKMQKSKNENEINQLSGDGLRDKTSGTAVNYNQKDQA